MKKTTILSILFFVFTQFASAQSNAAGFVNLRLGGNLNLAATLTTSQLGNITSDEDTSGVLATTIPLTVDVGIHKLLSASIGVSAGSWLNEDPNDPDFEVRNKATRSFKIGLKFYPINKDNFNLYLGYDFGLSGFRKEKYYNSTLVTETQHWKGTANFINLGTNFYFGSKFGMYFQLGYTGYNLKLMEFESSLGNINIDYINDLNFSANSIVKGFQTELGFCYNFGK